MYYVLNSSWLGVDALWTYLIWIIYEYTLVWTVFECALSRFAHSMNEPLIPIPTSHIFSSNYFRSKAVWMLWTVLDSDPEQKRTIPHSKFYLYIQKQKIKFLTLYTDIT